MTRLNIPLSLLAAVLLVAGCGSSTSTPAEGKGANAAKEDGGAPPTAKPIGTLTGPGGSVSLGDPPKQFEAAFPRPKDALDAQDAALEDLKLVGWQTQTEVASAAVRDGKVVALFHATMSTNKQWFDAARSDYGKPENDVENTIGAFANWRQGSKEHLVMLVKGQSVMTVRATGDSDTLKKLQLDSASIVAGLKAQGEAAASQGHSPDDGHGH
jgi:hypothetical protein